MNTQFKKTRNKFIITLYFSSVHEKPNKYLKIHENLGKDFEENSYETDEVKPGISRKNVNPAIFLKWQK